VFKLEFPDVAKHEGFIWIWYYGMMMYLTF